MILLFDKNDLSFKKAKRSLIKNVLFLLFMISYLCLIIFCIKLYENQDINNINNHTIGSQQWKDSIFFDYENRAMAYLSEFDKTPITAHMLTLAAHNAYDSTGIILPLELALAQATIESSLGTLGRSPINNPFNIGEHDDRTTLYFNNTFDGIQAYYYIMCNNYLRCKDMNTLLKNFTNCAGNRYASKITYEDELKTIINRINKIIEKKIKE
jgi:hypothetical protein